MISIHAKLHIGPDGVLELHLPTEITDSDVEVMVILNEIRATQPMQYDASKPKGEWQKFVRETAGAWQGEPIIRADQGEYQDREPLK